MIDKAEERTLLVRSFRVTLAYLIMLSVAPLILIVIGVSSSRSSAPLWMLAAGMGIVGSATSALVSALDRHANGFEFSDGTAAPDPSAKKERFSQRMVYWFWVRPWLGGIVAVVVFLGFQAGFWKGAADMPSPARIAFYGFLSGLLAKSVLDILRALPKNVFRQ